MLKKKDAIKRKRNVILLFDLKMGQHENAVRSLVDQIYKGKLVSCIPDTKRRKKCHLERRFY